MRKNQILCVATGFLLSACIEEVNTTKIEESAQKIVVNSIISPDFEEITVQVSYSKSVFGFTPDQQENADLITNALVTISSDALKKELIYDHTKSEYILSTSVFPIVGGKTYRLAVNVGKTLVQATTTVPGRISKIDVLQRRRGQFFEFSWRDLKNQDNYYRISAKGLEGSMYSPETGELFLGNTYSLPFDTDQFVSDIHRDGEKLVAKAENVYPEVDYNRIMVSLVSGDEYYSDYFEVLEFFDLEDPFSEPVPLPSNVEGGLGVFVAVQVSEFITDLP